MKHASLFSGIGGAELAASWMGWDNIFHCEINPFGRRVLDFWFPKSKSYEDITKTDFREWRGKIDVLTGGFPCQPFSQAGKRKGDTDDRYLWPQMLRAIKEIRPTWVVGENVAGIVTMVESCEEVEMGRADDIFEENIIYRKEQEFTIERICKDFEREGYSVQPIVIPACAVGAPHRRDRVWFIAHANGDGYISSRPCERIKEQNNEAPQQNKRGFSSERINGLSGLQQSITDTNCNGLIECNGEYEKQSDKRRLNALNDIKQMFTCSKIGKTNKWKNFPTQSPVCCGNDGISDRLDGITLPKWRAESIKAYGNAWVPQVAYEIFKAITNKILWN